VGNVIKNLLEAKKATHVVIPNYESPIQISLKLLVSLCVTPNIVSPAWLYKQSKSNECVPVESFCPCDFQIDQTNIDFKHTISMSKVINNLQLQAKHKSKLFQDCQIRMPQTRIDIIIYDVWVLWKLIVQLVGALKGKHASEERNNIVVFDMNTETKAKDHSRVHIFDFVKALLDQEFDPEKFLTDPTKDWRLLCC
jgi:hypothetical protein